MPSIGLWASSPIGSAISSGRRTSSAASGRNWRAIGSCGSAGSIRSATSAVSASAERATTASIPARRAREINPAASRSSGRRKRLRAGLMAKVLTGKDRLRAREADGNPADGVPLLECQSALGRHFRFTILPVRVAVGYLAGRRNSVLAATRHEQGARKSMKNYLDGGEAIL